MGTDSGVTPHGRNLRELELMRQGGMTPGAVLEATTRSAAQLLGVDGELGTLEPGKRADLTIVRGRRLRSGDPARAHRLGVAGRRPCRRAGRPRRLTMPGALTPEHYARAVDKLIEGR